MADFARKDGPHARAIRAVLTLLITVSLVFLFIRFSGDPAAALVPPDAPEEVIELYRQAMGLANVRRVCEKRAGVAAAGSRATQAVRSNGASR